MTAPFERPALALRIGITGHRWREPHHRADERLDRANADAVRQAIRRVLERVRLVTGNVHSTHADLFAEREPVLSLVSALAEGADELAAEVAVEPSSGFVLDIVAPYDLATYAARCAPGTPTRALWDKARARLILDGQPLADEPHDANAPRHRYGVRDEDALIETNRRLVWNCDLVIAVWDGHDARGDAGTAKVIERARAEGLPVIHIHSVHPDRIRLLDALGGELARRAPNDGNGANGESGINRQDDVWRDIERVVERLLEPPEPAAHGDQRAQSAVLRALREYARETPPGAIVANVGARIFGAAQLLLAGSGRLVGLARTVLSTAVPWQPVPTAHDMSVRRREVIDPAFQRADYFATVYGARHRSTFTTILFFAPFAVVCAWAGSQVHEEYKLWLALGELALLTVLTTFFVRSRRLRFHEKWLDYRLLAERIRHLGFLWPLGRTSPVIRVPTHAVFTDPRPAWVNWWYRALTREAGVPHIELDEPTVRALAEQIDRDLIRAQLAYNHHTHEVAHRAEHRLHAIPWVPLIAALLAALTHVAENLHLIHLDSTAVRWLTGIGILGPAFGAAFHGFASQAGFQEVGIRTDASAQQLERFAERLAQIDLSAPLASRALGDLTLSVADVMGEDLAGWRVDYLSRPVNPPG